MLLLVITILFTKLSMSSELIGCVQSQTWTWIDSIAVLHPNNGSVYYESKRASGEGCGQFFKFENVSQCNIYKNHGDVARVLDCKSLEQQSEGFFSSRIEKAKWLGKSFLEGKNLYGVNQYIEYTEEGEVIHNEIIFANFDTYKYESLFEFTSDCNIIDEMDISDDAKEAYVTCFLTNEKNVLIYLDLENKKQKDILEIGSRFFQNFKYYKGKLFGYQMEFQTGSSFSSFFSSFDLEKKKLEKLIHVPANPTYKGNIEDGKFYTQLVNEAGLLWNIIDLDEILQLTFEKKEEKNVLELTFV